LISSHLWHNRKVKLLCFLVLQDLCFSDYNWLFHNDVYRNSCYWQFLSAWLWNWRLIHCKSHDSFVCRYTQIPGKNWSGRYWNRDLHQIGTWR
jgi:hypothetical protein